MRLLVQRATHASVTVDNQVIGQIEQGLCVLVGIGPDDGDKEIAWALRKLTNMRIFTDPDGKMNLSVTDIAGGILLISQFTLYGDARKGNRPSFIDAAKSDHAQPLFDRMVKQFEAEYKAGPIATGQFAADMKVDLRNDGPVTIWLES